MSPDTASETTVCTLGRPSLSVYVIRRYRVRHSFWPRRFRYISRDISCARCVPPARCFAQCFNKVHMPKVQRELRHPPPLQSKRHACNTSGLVHNSGTSVWLIFSARGGPQTAYLVSPDRALPVRWACVLGRPSSLAHTHTHIHQRSRRSLRHRCSVDIESRTCCPLSLSPRVLAASLIHCLLPFRPERPTPYFHIAALSFSPRFPQASHQHGVLHSCEVDQHRRRLPLRPRQACADAEQDRK